MNTTATPAPPQTASPSAQGGSHIWFLLAFTVLLVGAFWASFRQWYAVSEASSDSTHLVLMPLVAGFLLWMNRESIFERTKRSVAFFVPLLLFLGGAAAAGMAPLEGWEAQDQSALRIALLALAWIAAFGLLFGGRALKRAAFPLGMLLLMIPIPTYLLGKIIYFLQVWSAEGTALAFKVGPLPYFRDGFTFILPGAAIEVAKECSGIRSSMALLITGLLASHLYLRTNWAKGLLVLAVVPLAIVKNCIRIVSLTYLAIYVDPSYLEGALHKRGGFVFFLITLVLYGFVLFALQKMEGRKKPAGVAPAATTPS
jgi:exosortase